MSQIKRGRPSPAIIAAALVLVAALAGTALAGPGPTANTAGKAGKALKLAKKNKKAINNIELTPGPAGQDGKDGADGADAVIPAPVYKPLALQNGWTTNAAYFSPSYSVDAQGLVRLRGLVIPGTGVVITTLPAEARPSKITQVPIYSGNGDATGLFIQPDGQVSANSGLSAALSLDGVTFHK